MTEPAALLLLPPDVAVVGAGPAGLAAALQIARSGFDCSGSRRRRGPTTPCTNALLAGGSVPFLKQLASTRRSGCRRAASLPCAPVDVIAPPRPRAGS